MKNKKKSLLIVLITIIVIVAIVGIVKWRISKKEEDALYAKRADQSDDSKLEEIMNAGTHEEPESYTSSTEYSEGTVSEESTQYTSTGFEENAVLVDNGVTATFMNVEITRDAEDSNDETGAKTYGIGAALLAKNSVVSLLDSTITTTGKGATGAFAYGTGILLVSDTEITTYGDNAGGIHASVGGSVVATDVNVTTYGENSAAVRSEADGQVMTISGGTYETNGQDSPAIYSLAEVKVENATMTANNAEAVCIDGAHSVTIENSDITGNMMSVYQRFNYNGKALVWTVGITQTMKKNETYRGNFTMVGGSLTSKNGGLFYTTNTASNIILKNVNITPSENSDFFLKCTGNDNVVEEKGIWGTPGDNGATCNFTAIEQKMEGIVYWDSISQLDFYMTEGSKLVGAVVDDESAVKSSSSTKAQKGFCNMYISADSTWVVTGDSTLSTLSSEGKIVDEKGNTVTIKSANGTTYVKGNSNYTVTVDRYLDTVNLTGALSV